MPTIKRTETTVYTFDELSDAAKETAREWFRTISAEDFPDFGADTVLEDAARMAQMFGLNIRQRPVKLTRRWSRCWTTPCMRSSPRMDPDVYWGVDSRDAGVSIAGSYAWKTGCVRAVSTEAPAEWTDRETGETKPQKSNAELNRIVRALADVQRRNFYQLTARLRHARRDFRTDVEVERNDGKPMTPDAEETVSECLRDFSEWIHSQLEAEWEYRQSDECVDEDIQANEYTFDVDGHRA